MKSIIFWLFVMSALFPFVGAAQGSFPYTLELSPVDIPELEGLHSYAFGESNGRYLIIGGRLDGLHARQPFNAFPQNQNNTQLRVIDPQMQQQWVLDMSVLSASLQEQLQSTNMCFDQRGDSLYIAGGYAYSASAGDHITFPYLTALHVEEVIQGVIQGMLNASSFRQVADERMAVTGGRLVHTGTSFLLVGGHRFDGRYNPMGMPSYTQTYTNAIRGFHVLHENNGISIVGLSEQVDEVNLHRRDYNLVPWLSDSGIESLVISSGVFQVNADLPFLYPVEIDGSEVLPETSFNQYLSNYHCPTVSLFDGVQTHALFFGGMSQYYYSNGSLVQDNQVPFVRTISKLTRTTEGVYEEALMPVEMPGLKGAGAEFFVNSTLPISNNGVVRLDQISGDTIDVGFIYGGILSGQLNPFSTNQTSTTTADAVLYRVQLLRQPTVVQEVLPGQHGRSIHVYPNPIESVCYVEANVPFERADYFLTDGLGRTIAQGSLSSLPFADGRYELELSDELPPQLVRLTVVFENRYYATQTLMKL
jgi:hypothetical protein